MKILVVLSRVPYPLIKGDKLRAFNQIKYLSQHHEVYLFCVSHEKIDPQSIETLKKYCVEICAVRISFFAGIFNTIKALFKGLPFQVGYFYSCKAKRNYDLFEQKINPDRLYCQFIRTAEYVRNSKIPKTLDYQDALSTNIERRVPKSPFYIRPVLRYESTHLREYEARVFDLFNEKTIISEADRECINHPKKDLIHVIPNGVDMDYFYPMPDIEKMYNVVFIGNMSYPPNVDAAHFLVKEIMPLVWKKKSAAKVLLAGVNPVASVRALASKQVEVSGWVDDIRKCYAQARIFIAPMRIGTGLQNKLLEAMAMQIPCITSTLSNASLQAKDKAEILIADSPQEYADAIEMLSANTETANGIGLNGYCYIYQKFSWNTFSNLLEKVIEKSNH